MRVHTPEMLNYDDVTQFTIKEITCLFLYDLATLILVGLVFLFILHVVLYFLRAATDKVYNNNCLI